MHNYSINDIIAIGYNFKVIFIEGETMKSSLDFIESGCSRSYWAIYFAPRFPSSCCCINEYLAIYSCFLYTSRAVSTTWLIYSPINRVGAGRSIPVRSARRWSVRSARVCGVMFARGWSVRSDKGWSVRSAWGWGVSFARGWSVRSERGWSWRYARGGV